MVNVINTAIVAVGRISDTDVFRVNFSCTYLILKHTSHGMVAIYICCLPNFLTAVLLQVPLY